MWGGLAFMSTQFGVLARLTWWEYSWDIMEPVTYFVTTGTAIICYGYFLLTQQVSNKTKCQLCGQLNVNAVMDQARFLEFFSPQCLRHFLAC